MVGHHEGVGERVIEGGRGDGADTRDGEVGLGATWLTMTLKWQELVLPAASIAVNVTTLVPMPNVEPDGGAELVEASEQLSLATGAG